MGSGFSGLLGKKAFEGIESGIPHRPDLVSPIGNLVERGRIQSANPLPPNLFRSCQAGSLKHTNVLQGCCKRDLERPCKFGNRLVPIQQHLHHGEPSRISKCFKYL